MFVALQLFVMQSTLSAFVVGAGAQRRARLEEETSLEWRPCTDGSSSAPMATCPVASSWKATHRMATGSRSAHRRHGPQRRSSGTGATSVVATWANRCSSRWPQSQNTLSCQEDIVMAAVAEPAGDEPAAAGDGASADEPAEPCT